MRSELTGLPGMDGISGMPGLPGLRGIYHKFIICVNKSDMNI